MKRFAFIFLLCLNGGAYAADSSDPWLTVEKASQAAHRLNYKGVFLYQSGSVTNSMHITHMNYGARGEFARIVVLDGTPREVLRQGNNAVIYQPQKEKVLIDKRRLQSGFPALLPSVSDDIRTNYQIRVQGEERVGGRDGQVLLIESRDKNRYRYKFWADKDSGILLKLVILNDKDEILEQVAFNQLTLVNEDRMDWFHPEVQPGKRYEMAEEEKVASGGQDFGWAINSIPVGFRKTDQVVRTFPGKSNPVNQLVFWDGLVSVSLFVEPVVPQPNVARTGMYSQGATNVLVTLRDGHQVIVMGEVPPQVIQLFSNAVVFGK